MEMKYDNFHFVNDVVENLAVSAIAVNTGMLSFDPKVHRANNNSCNTYLICLTIIS